jgi:hypothetical protein
MLQKTPAAVPASTAKTLLDVAQEFSRAVQASPRAAKTLVDLAQELSRAGEAWPQAVEALHAQCWADFVVQEAQKLLGDCLYAAKDLDRELARLRAKRPPQKRGRRRQTENRDLTIATAIAAVARDGFSPTRSHATHHPAAHSACSIIQAALAEIGVSMSERTVEGIWERHKNLFAPLARP